jgi:hypothetical protein
VAACIGSTLRLILFDQNHIDAVSGTDYINFQSANNATATTHPRLIVTYTEGGVTAAYSGRGIGRGIVRGIMR